MNLENPNERGVINKRIRETDKGLISNIRMINIPTKKHDLTAIIVVS